MSVDSGLEDFEYLSGFGNEHQSEAVPGALPVGRNSPQRPPLGLYAEQVSGTAFTAPRALNRRTWTYRILPSARHPEFVQIDSGRLRGAPFAEMPAGPNRLRWDPTPTPQVPTDFVESLVTIGGNGSIQALSGIAIHTYAMNAPMTGRYFFNSDGELLIVPQSGRMIVDTEMGRLAVRPGEIVVIPRGIRFRANPVDAVATGYICENYGASLVLPERGPIGSNGMANERDFLAPVAWYEDLTAPVTVIQKYDGKLWETQYDHSPLDVVAWHGSYYPYKYDLARFMTIGTISYDHPDPSIFTVLTSPSENPGTANVDFVIFPPRWLVGEDTYRPPWFHRNIMSEFMGLVTGEYDAKAEGFLPGGSSLHNMFTSHGSDVETFERASNDPLAPKKVDDTLAFMFETRWAIRVTQDAYDAAHRQTDYDSVWQGLERHFRGE